MMAGRLRLALVTAATVAAVLLTASLGRWQLQRAHDKEAIAEAMVQQQALPAWGNAELDQAALGLANGQLDGLQHRSVQLQGQWLAEHTVFLDNRQMYGRPGFFVLTPLRLLPPHAHLVVVVQRGWVPRNFQDRTALAPVDTPPGTVTVQGRVAPPPSKIYEFSSGTTPDRQGPQPAQGADPDLQTSRIRQNIDIPDWAVHSGLPLVAWSVVQTGAASQGLQRDWPALLSGVDKHYGYAFQWFGLSVLMAVLYVWFQFVRRFFGPRRTS